MDSGMVVINPPPEEGLGQFKQILFQSCEKKDVPKSDLCDTYVLSKPKQSDLSALNTKFLKKIGNNKKEQIFNCCDLFFSPSKFNTFLHQLPQRVR